VLRLGAFERKVAAAPTSALCGAGAGEVGSAGAGGAGLGGEGGGVSAGAWFAPSHATKPGKQEAPAKAEASTRKRRLLVCEAIECATDPWRRTRCPVIFTTGEFSSQRRLKAGTATV